MNTEFVALMATDVGAFQIDFTSEDKFRAAMNQSINSHPVIWGALFTRTGDIVVQIFNPKQNNNTQQKTHEMYQVFENDKPADTSGYPKLTAACWANSKFDTFGDACQYAREYLGYFQPSSDYKFELDKPYYFNTDYFVVIRKIA